MLLTAQELIEGGLESADMVGSNFITPAGQLRYINQCYGEWYDLILECNQDDFVKNPPTEFTVSSGAVSYPLPSDFYSAIGLDRKFGGKWIEIRSFEFNRRNRLKSSWLYTARTIYPAVRFRVLGQDILFDSQDDAAGDYRIWYTPVPPKASLLTDTFFVEATTHQLYIETLFAIKALDKEESDSSKFEIKLAKLESKIRATKKNRNDGEPEKISNYDRYNDLPNEYDGWF